MRICLFELFGDLGVEIDFLVFKLFVIEFGSHRDFV